VNRLQIVGLSRAGYYRFRRRHESGPTVMTLRNDIQHIALRWPAYGYRRVHAELVRQGWKGLSSGYSGESDLVTDKQVRKLFALRKTERNQEVAAVKAGMDPKTAQKYLRWNRLPSELPRPPRWRTWPDPFAGVWEEVRELLETNPGLEAKTVFEHLQRRYPGRFPDGQLRTLQRVKGWRATEGPAKEVFFAQQHVPAS